MQPSAGSLLIASATLLDPHFARSLVLVLDANPDGALAVVLNRPTRTPVASVLPEWDGLTSEPGVFFDGGPVEGNAALALGLLDDSGADGAPDDGWRRLDGAPDAGSPAALVGGGRPLGLVDLDSEPQTWVGRLAALRVYAGYTGWGPGQLDEEIAEGSWHLAPALPSDLFTDRPDLLWRDVLRRQPAPVSMLTTLPEDASLN